MFFFFLSNTCFVAARGVIKLSDAHHRAESFVCLLPVRLHPPLTMLYFLFSFGYSLLVPLLGWPPPQGCRRERGSHGLRGPLERGEGQEAEASAVYLPRGE